ncbi:calcineurin-like phosphoesterase superfamily domain protein [Halalkalicoccus paucihalophilus]|uniref:Calcineurin-like phosphoesterase superfamily domain protein n=1 Tax=Halalkalicoccus paucihalophilus TaxID=1008153 RepID=A0A151ACV6_9EURY|nr:metallophosphoesterase [Halalkalicoccus paucihalophilus]KYH25380.1 calcineurin-like phosphoesterase superfamily domain protein [Halalkalicoccus paucihalophilus]
MALVEPVTEEPAATADLAGERAVVLADFHAGIEGALRYENGVEVASRAEQRREHVQQLLGETDADRLVILGDFMHSIGGPGGAERGEIEVFLESLTVPVTIVKGNHDGDIESIVENARSPRTPGEIPEVTVTSGGGCRLGDVGFCHGHSWPVPEVLGARVVCVGHEHPQVRLTDEVGGTRTERVWLRGALSREPFADRVGAWTDTDLVVFPAFNELMGGTWVNVGQDFLCPFLPDGLDGGEAYLLDGTRLGPYEAV